MDSFRTARFVVNLVQTFGWLAILGAALGSFVAYGDGFGSQAIALAVGGVFAGLITVAMAQMAIAVIATAENTAELVRLANSSKAEVPGRREPPALRGGLRPFEIGDLIKTYKGRKIYSAPLGVTVDGEPYPSVLAAEKAISRQSD